MTNKQDNTNQKSKIVLSVDIKFYSQYISNCPFSAYQIVLSVHILCRIKILKLCKIHVSIVKHSDVTWIGNIFCWRERFNHRPNTYMYIKELCTNWRVNRVCIFINNAILVVLFKWNSQGFNNITVLANNMKLVFCFFVLATVASTERGRWRM